LGGGCAYRAVVTEREAGGQTQQGRSRGLTNEKDAKGPSGGAVWIDPEYQATPVIERNAKQPRESHGGEGILGENCEIEGGEVQKVKKENVLPRVKPLGVV